MEETAPLFLEILLILGGGIVAGTLFKRIGLGTILGYLFAGIVMGPILRLVQHGQDEILHIGELGVVFLLFIIGLETSCRASGRCAGRSSASAPRRSW